MDKGRFMLTFAVAAAVILGGYFFANHIQSKKDAAVVDEQKTDNKLGLENPLQVADSDKVDVSQGANTPYVPTNANGNVTRMVAQSLFSKMQQMDQGGKNPFGQLDTSDPQTRSMIEDTIQNVPDTIFATAISASEIKITADNSRDAKMRYMQGVSQITKQYFYTSDANQFTVKSSQELINNLQKDCFESDGSTKNAALSKEYKGVFEAYKGLTVPSSWVAMHKVILGYFKELGDIYGAFTQCKEDPIRAYVGIDRLPDVYAETSTIQKMLNEKAVELGLH